MHLEGSENKPRSIRNIEIDDSYHAKSDKCIKGPYSRNNAYKSLINKIAKLDERGKKPGESHFHAFMPKVSNVNFFYKQKKDK
jgi:hypothetical protein